MSSVDNIEFELRFSKKFAEHERMKNIYLNLLEKFAVEYHTKTSIEPSKIILFQVERLGFSGAKVFYVTIEKLTGHSDTRIAKFDVYKNVQSEAQSAKDFGEEIYGPYQYIDPENSEYGLLIYDEIDHGDEFHYLFLDQTVNTEFLVSVLEKLYSKIYTNYYDIGTIQGSKKNFKDYKWYLDRKNKPIAKLKSISGYLNEDFSINKLCDFYKGMSVKNYEVNCTKIHGDLHARNIMSNDHDVHLIDYAWVHNGHIAKDFTLLECTILYMLLPDYMLSKTHTHLLSLEYEIFLNNIYSSFSLSDFNTISEDADRDKVYRRAFESLKVIRKYAVKALKKYKSESFNDIFEEYQFSILMMSLSQISFESVQLEILLSTTTRILENVNETV